MIWIILALTLGASITSIIHGVFMLFGSLAVTGAAIPGIPSTMLAVLPIISAIFALIGGIIAFNQSKWGALFLFIAMGLCVPSKDTWLYGGLYFFAGLFCFFLKRKAPGEYSDLYDASEDYSDYDSDTDDSSYNDAQDFYYASDALSLDDDQQTDPLMNLNVRPIGEDVSVVEPQPNNAPPKIRRRMSKSCPECGAVVARDAFYCPTCGAKLFVVNDQVGGFSDVNNASPSMPILEHAPLDDASGNFSEDIQRINEQLFNSPATGDPDLSSEVITEDNNLNMNDGDDDMASTQTVPNYRTTINPRREESSYASTGTRRSTRNSISPNEAATSYTEYATKFSKGKKRKKSPLRKVFSMLLLVAAVGGALCSLLMLRKLPPSELPPIARPEIVNASGTTTVPTPTPAPTPRDTTPPLATEVVVAENVLPDFTPERAPTNGVVIGSNVNVRADHSTNSNRITRLNVGTRVEVIGTFNVTSGQYSGIWYNIRTNGREGWIYGKYLQPLGTGLPAGYSNALLKTFGGNRSEIVESLGNPTKSTSSTAEWPGLTVTLSGEEITRLRLTNSSRELQNGLKPGMSQTALLQIMGYPSGVNNKTMNYNENGKTGLSVQLDKNNAISTITVSEVQ